MARGVSLLFIAFLSSSALLPLAARGQGSVPFIRGDSNSDGRVSISDAHYTARHLFLAGAVPECLAAADENDDGMVSYDDVTFAVRHLVQSDPPLPGPPPPFPTPDGLGCAAYGNGSALDDPDAELRILDAETPGGGKGHISITLAVSSSSSIAGYFASIRDVSGVIESIGEAAGEGSGDLTGTFDGYSSSLTGLAYSVIRKSKDNEIRVAFLAHPSASPDFIPAGTARPVLRLSACLKQGTGAGQYPLTVEAAELVDGASGQAILPAKRSGAIRVLAAVSDTECRLDDPEGLQFLRGDFDGDGTVSYSDVRLAAISLFVGGKPPAECVDAMDANDDGRWNWADPIFTARFLFAGGPVLPPPFPSRGIDTTPGGVACGKGPALDDPSARVQVLDAEAPGGVNRRVSIILALSSSTSLAAYSVMIRDEAGVIERIAAPATGFTGDLTNRTEPAGFSFVEMEERSGIRVGFLAAAGDPPGPIPPGTDVPVFRIAACLKDGTPAGEYPLTVEAAELVDSASAAVFLPVRVSGTLRVFDSIQDSACDMTGQPDSLNVVFKIAEGSGKRGEEVPLPFIIKADRPSQGFSFSVDHDETVLEATEIRKVFVRPDGVPYEFERFETDNEDAVPGSSGIQEGFAAGAAIISFSDTQTVLPVFREVRVLEIVYRIKPSAPDGKTELRFIDGARGERGSVNNKLIAGGKEVTPTQAASFVFIHGRLNIISDISIFIRGDSNRDGLVDVSDAITTLAFLFTGGEGMPCPDAADADDSGSLELTDAVVTLQHLFLGGPALPPPFPGRGRDETDDLLGCN